MSGEITSAQMKSGSVPTGRSQTVAPVDSIVGTGAAGGTEQFMATQKQIAASTQSVGDMYDIEAMLRVTNFVSGTCTVKLWMGATTLIAAPVLAIAGTNDIVHLRARVFVTVAGASGVIYYDPFYKTLLNSSATVVGKIGTASKDFTDASTLLCKHSMVSCKCKCN
jgi:hypothetical protein